MQIGDKVRAKEDLILHNLVIAKGSIGKVTRTKKSLNHLKTPDSVCVKFPQHSKSFLAMVFELEKV